MKQSPAERLEWILKTKGLTELDLRKVTERSRSQVWRYLTGYRPLSPKVARRIEKALGINAQWLLEGTGPVEIAKETTAVANEKQDVPEKETANRYPENQSEPSIMGQDRPITLLTVVGALQWIIDKWSDAELREKIGEALDSAPRGVATILIEFSERRKPFSSSKVAAAVAAASKGLAEAEAAKTPGYTRKPPTGEPSGGKSSPAPDADEAIKEKPAAPKPAPK